jgi:hypothetical protein
MLEELVPERSSFETSCQNMNEAPVQLDMTRVFATDICGSSSAFILITCAMLATTDLQNLHDWLSQHGMNSLHPPA